MAKLGLKTLSMAVDKHWERLPDAAFRLDTYNPFADNNDKKDSEKKGDRDKDRDLDRNRRRNSSHREGHRSRRSRSDHRDSPHSQDSATRLSYSSSRDQRLDPQSQQLQQQQQQQAPYQSQQPQSQLQPQFPPNQQQIQQQPYSTPQPHPSSFPALDQRTYQPQDQFAHLTLQSSPPSSNELDPSQQIIAPGDPNFPQTARNVQQPAPPEYSWPDTSSTAVNRSVDEQTAQTGKPPSPPMQNDQGYPPPPSRDASGYHRYNPADYTPQGYSGSSYHEDRYVPAQYQQQDQYQSQHSSGYYNDDRGAHDSYGSASEDRRGRRERKHSHRDRSGSGSREGSERESGFRGFAHKNFDYESKRGLASSALGAAAGGYIGHRLGKGTLSTVAGVLLGGVAANAWETREERHKAEKRRDMSRSRSRSHRRARSEGRHSRYIEDDRYAEPMAYSGRSSGGGSKRVAQDAYYDDYDRRDGSEDEYEPKHRSRSSRRDRDRDRDRY